MENELARDICQNAEDKYEDLFIIETTTSNEAKGEPNMRRRADPVYDKVIHNRRIANIAKDYAYDPAKQTLMD